MRIEGLFIKKLLEVKNNVLKNKVHYLTDDFTTRNSNRTHNGMDFIGKNYGADYVIAVEKGKVIAASYGKSTGYYVEIEHPNKVISRYLHLKKNSITVKKGEEVKKGQIIGYMGNTGDATGVHLHFAIKVNGKQVDPKPYLLGEKGFLNKKTDIIYQVYDNNRKQWLKTVTNDNDYAGIFKSPIGGLRVKMSDSSIVKVRSHVNGKWLPEVTKWNENSDGYSGIKGENIDAIMIKSDKHKISYRVYTDKWYSWVTGYATNDSKNGYAGIFGKNISAVQIKIIN